MFTRFEECLMVMAAGLILLASYYGIRAHIQPAFITRVRRDAALLRDVVAQLPELDPDIRLLVRRFDETKIISGSETYTLHKKRIVLCDESDTNFSEEDNHVVRLLGVIHEMAHVMTPEYGHGENFWQNFGVLMHQAELTGIMDGAALDRILNSEPPFKFCDHYLHSGYAP